MTLTGIQLKTLLERLVYYRRVDVLANDRFYPTSTDDSAQLDGSAVLNSATVVLAHASSRILSDGILRTILLDHIIYHVIR